MSSQAPVYGVFATLVAALLAAAVAVFINIRDQRSRRRDEELTQRREIYSRAFAAVASTQQALIGLLRPYRTRPSDSSQSDRWEEGIKRHWKRLEEAQQEQIEAHAMLRLLGRRSVNDAMTRVIAHLVVMQLIMRTAAGEIGPVKTIGSSMAEALRIQDLLEDEAMPRLMAAMKLDLGYEEIDNEVTIATEIEALELEESAPSANGGATGP